MEADPQHLSRAADPQHLGSAAPSPDTCRGRATNAKAHFTKEEEAVGHAQVPQDSRGKGRGVPGGFLEEKEQMQHEPRCGEAGVHEA